jgi:hypothetical protein
MGRDGIALDVCEQMYGFRAGKERLVRWQDGRARLGVRGYNRWGELLKCNAGQWNV